MTLTTTTKLTGIGIGYLVATGCVITSSDKNSVIDTDAPTTIDTSINTDTDTDTLYTYYTDDTGTLFYDVPPEFQKNSWGDSLDGSVWTIHASTHGWFVDGLLNIYETRYTRDYDEEHDLIEIAHDPDGYWSDLSIDLTTDEFTHLVEPNVSTAFAASELPTTNTENKATLVMRVYDDSGALSDCIIWGDDPDIVLNDLMINPKTYAQIPIPSEIIDHCVAVSR